MLRPRSQSAGRLALLVGFRNVDGPAENAARIDAAELLRRLAGVRRHVRAGVVAANKPLTLLWALDRVARGEPRMVAFADAEPQLAELLGEFAGAGTAVSYAFWRLQHDGVWEVVGGEDLPPRSSDKEPKVTALRASASGGFPVTIQTAFEDDPALLERAFEVVFASLDGGPAPPPVSDDTEDDEPRTRTSQVTRRVRDAAFRERVLRAYGYRCVVCGYGVLRDGRPVGLEAAHVESHGRRGPDRVSNGLALCALHHRLFDSGLFGWDDRRRLTAVDAPGPWGEIPALDDHVGRPLADPVDGSPPVADEHLAWHREHVLGA